MSYGLLILFGGPTAQLLLLPICLSQICHRPTKTILKNNSGRLKQHSAPVKILMIGRRLQFHGQITDFYIWQFFCSRTLARPARPALVIPCGISHQKVASVVAMLIMLKRQVLLGVSHTGSIKSPT